MEKLNKSARLQALVKYYSDGNKTKFAQKIGVTPQCISTWIARNNMDYDQIFTNCENLSAKWLLTGEGEIIETDPKIEVTERTILTELLDRIEKLTSENAVLRYKLNQNGIK